MFNWIIISILFLILIGANTYLSLTSLEDLNKLQTKITDYDSKLLTLQNAQLSLLNAQSGQRGFLLTKNTAYLEHYNEAIIKVRLLMLDVAEIGLEQQEQQSAIKQLLGAVDEKIKGLESTVQKVKNTADDQVLRTFETDEDKLFYAKTHQLFEQIIRNESSMRNEQVSLLQRVRYESQRNNIISLITSLLLVFGILVLARVNTENNRKRQNEIEKQNLVLQNAVNERTKEISLFSDELARSNRELEDFAFVASHDLQEPLRKIMAFGDRLSSQGENLTDKQADYLQRMRKAASRMSTLISDLLEFSRVATRGKTFESVDLNFIIVNCIDDLNVLIEETNTQVTFDKAPVVIADPIQMQQLFFNLIANAVKFSQKNSQAHVEIAVTQVEQPASIDIDGLHDWYQFSVKDNGIGFEPEHAEKIFAPFQRLHSRDSFKGTGIGLAICRRIVERHNGLIIATGTPDKGAVFEVTLPAKNRLISIK